jgi:serine/threonine protein kinase
MDRKIDPSAVETTLEPPPAVPEPDPSSVSKITSVSAADEGRFVPGTLLGGRYRIIGLLGRGGMGEVYRATDMMLGQSVALKFLPEEAASNPRLLERFHGEVRVARQVSHPNVCRVYDIGEIEGMPFISMERFLCGGVLFHELAPLNGDRDCIVGYKRTRCKGFLKPDQRIRLIADPTQGSAEGVYLGVERERPK